ncbi:MAG: addiction module protein [Holophagales bacterium]|jgi:hypothetical protein|nr:addiction module protein [Holophagales bacterium]MBK9967760.1 addiction module protein [Holophagales bacterium]
MTTTIPRERAIAAAMKLPAESWALLFELLIGDIPVETDPEVEAAWLAEVERRMRETDPSKLIPGDVVFARVRAAMGKPRPERSPVEVSGVILAVRDVIEACEALPVADRLELAGRYLEREQASGQSRHPRTWLEDSARWLTAARAAEC